MLKIIYLTCLSYLLMATSIVRCKPDYLFNVEAGGWLKLHRIPDTWQEAFLRCYYEGAVLASPLNEQLTTALTTRLTQSGVKGHIFLGTHDLYSKGHFTSIEGVPLSNMEINWSEYEVGTDDCLAMFTINTEYFMKTTSCTDRLPFICYRKLDNQTLNECGTFDDEYHYKQCTGSCYKVHQQTQTWSRAYGICDSEGGHLVILNNKDEARIVKDMFPQRTEQGIWDRFHVGLAAWSDARIWVTIQGEKFKDVFNDWNEHQPNNFNGRQNRVSFVRAGALDDVDPDFEAMFVCEKSPQSIQYEELNESTQNSIINKF